MTSDASQRKSIDGKGKTLREILFGRKFYIDYYQREYKWQTKQLEELVSDLTDVFFRSYEPGHERRAARSRRRHGRHRASAAGRPRLPRQPP